MKRLPLSENSNSTVDDNQNVSKKRFFYEWSSATILKESKLYENKGGAYYPPMAFHSALAISPDENILLNAVFYETTSKVKLRLPPKTPLESITRTFSNLNFSSSRAGDCLVQVWDIKQEKCLQTISLNQGGKRIAIRALAVFPDGTFVAGDSTGTITHWNPTKWVNKCLQTITPSKKSITALLTLPNYIIVSGSASGAVSIWDIKSGKCLETLVEDNIDSENEVNTLLIFKETTLLIGYPGGCVLWDINNSKRKWITTLHIPEDHTRSISKWGRLSNDTFVSCGVKSGIEIWNIQRNKCVKKFNFSVENFVIMEGDIIAFFCKGNGSIICYLDPHTGVVKSADSHINAHNSFVISTNGMLFRPLGDTLALYPVKNKKEFDTSSIEESKNSPATTKAEITVPTSLNKLPPVKNKDEVNKLLNEVATEFKYQFKLEGNGIFAKSKLISDISSEKVNTCIEKINRVLSLEPENKAALNTLGLLNKKAADEICDTIKGWLTAWQKLVDDRKRYGHRYDLAKYILCKDVEDYFDEATYNIRNKNEWISDELKAMAALVEKSYNWAKTYNWIDHLESAQKFIFNSRNAFTKLKNVNPSQDMNAFLADLKNQAELVGNELHKINAKKVQKEKENLERRIQEEKKQKAKVFYKQACKAMENGKDNEAMEQYKQACSINSKPWDDEIKYSFDCKKFESVFKNGSTLEELDAQGKYDIIIKIFGMIDKQDPFFSSRESKLLDAKKYIAWIFYLRACKAIEEGKDNEALEQYKKAYSICSKPWADEIKDLQNKTENPFESGSALEKLNVLEKYDIIIKIFDMIDRQDLYSSDKEKRILQAKAYIANRLYEQGQNCESNADVDSAVHYYDLALEVIANVADSQSDKINICNAQARLAYQQKNIDKALQYYDQVINLDPYRFIAWQAKFSVVYSTQNVEKAIYIFHKAIETNLTNSNFFKEICDYLYSIGEYSTMVEFFDKFVAAVTNNDLSFYYYKGKALQAQKRFEEAITSYNILLNAYDESAINNDATIGDDEIAAKVYVNTIICFLYLKRNKEAIFLFKKAATLHPSFIKEQTSYIQAMGIMHFLEGLANETLIYLQRAEQKMNITTDKISLVELFIERAEFFLALKDHSQATEALEKVLALDANHCLAKSRLKDITSAHTKAQSPQPVSSNIIPPVTVEISFHIAAEDLTLGKKIGEGSFGIVFQGKYRYTDVAIKQLQSTQLSDAVLEEFQQEMKIMARLRHPNIVQLYGVTNKTPYCMVMEYCSKGDLHNLLHSKEGKELSWEQRAHIALDIAYGLAYLHKEKILHRDLKSKNILLDKNMMAKLADFGLSKVKAETSTSSTGKMVGTLQWMAPEIIQGEVYTLKADIYSYGMVAWELSSNRTPFEKANGNQFLIAMWVSQGKREDIPEGTPKKLSELMQHCWAQEVEKRPTSEVIIQELEGSSNKEEEFISFSKPSAHPLSYTKTQPQGGNLAKPEEEIISMEHPGCKSPQY